MHPRTVFTAIRPGVILALVTLAMVACSNDDRATAFAPPAEASAESAKAEATSTSTPTPTPTSTPTPTPTPTALGIHQRSLSPLTLDPEQFSSSVEVLDAVVTSRVVGSSWHEGCPTPLDQLRYVEVTHRTNDGGSAIGELIVNEAVVDDIVLIFATLYEAGFPIQSLRLVDDFGADDLRSMRANNTSAFNCRFVSGTTNWSWHAYGRAIDLNPLINPYVTPAGIDPPEGELFADRSQTTPGMIHAGDEVTNAFIGLGWEWGGNWQAGRDYQHFARTGR